MALFVDVILPLPLDSLFTYTVQDNPDDVKQGCRVIVQFGKRKYYTAIVVNVYEGEPKEGIKEIISVLDREPIVFSTQLEFWNWVSSYYMCSIGDVYKAALPSALKLESETLIAKIDGFEKKSEFTPTELKVYYALPDNEAVKISELEKQLKISNIIPYVKSLVDKGAIEISEDIRNNYISKKRNVISLAKDFSERELHLFIDILQRAKKQQQLLMEFLRIREEASDIKLFSIDKKELSDKTGIASAIIDALVDRKILKQTQEEISRFNYGQANPEASNTLNAHQQEAYNKIQSLFNNKSVVLLHGVTSSGKTEIYIRMIAEAIARGQQVLYLLPEIALTTQITERLKSVFGNKLSVYHSKFNDNERAETWTTLVSQGEGRVVLGARSAIFLPFSDLSLIIVDEEHESSYKQQDPAPRYNARNAAIVLANIHKCKVLLGTATPSVETYYNARNGKFGLVTLTKRHDEIELPEIVPVNTKELKRRKQMKSVLSPPLIDKMKIAFSDGKQAILFQNRRGFAPLIECKVCSWTKYCDHCDVSLTYHKGQGVMVCHYCGATYRIPDVCPNCETPTLDVVGYGTERIAEEVGEVFPDASIARMDLDTTRTKRAYEHIISDFESGKTNVLIGTQMVSKGLDFDNVTVVGILNADGLLNYPDFRAHEKAFQLMTQVSGRAGRKNARGLVLLQTANPQHPIIKDVVNNDYENFYDTQIAERQLFRYPPFYRLISVVLKARDERVLEEASRHFAQILRESFGENVLGPTKPPVARVQSLYIRNILLKVEIQASPQKVRDAIKYYKEYLFSQPDFKSVLIQFDVDPLV
ncbi:primosomal protein N' [Dysgonomonas sp. 216]|uniref:replication restart helicase PriA n=1 Tax=Dysgonomonas sp. 216 TaxID=2302934 RepID=UPI0013D10F36|nr:primosomal protein N' [Dysgonomonas sp. 216]NDW18282.1 primosomal protein N' [Dysgonomonas sp. 216]NDW18650.1 primosomal protein N' [Dysgonomonas sp. 216]